MEPLEQDFILSDKTKLHGVTWSQIRDQAMSGEYSHQNWFLPLSITDKHVLNELIKTQQKQGNKEPLVARPFRVTSSAIKGVSRSSEQLLHSVVAHANFEFIYPCAPSSIPTSVPNALLDLANHILLHFDRDYFKCTYPDILWGLTGTDAKFETCYTPALMDI